jgi:hypothetical protein
MGVSAIFCKGPRTGAVWRLLLHPDRIAIAIPVQDLDPVALPVGEDEEGPDRIPLSWQALSSRIQRRLRSRTRGRCWNWPSGATDNESRTTEEPHHVPIPSQPFPRPPPRRTNQPPRAPLWPDLPDEQRLQLLRVLNRMLTYRLADDEAGVEEGDHERH